MESEAKVQEQIRKITETVNRKLKPVEDAFMAYVIGYKVLGYGRMIQLIQAHWDKELQQDRYASMDEGGGKGSMELLP